ncbi:acetylornithine deacetylase [Pseudophaeobacter sp.]|uniref:acetylornithine deacetylase n=1 Tax=Pseudophaeobacter sp. TaxID=1971739 RepID=UPI003A9779CE
MTQTLDILERLIGFDTVSAKSNLALIDYVQSFLADRGFQVHRVPDASGQKAGLFAVLGPVGKGVMLSAHSDVVPVTGQDWTRDPFRLSIDGARAYGRGTTDMKGYLASMLALADRASKITLREPLKIALSYDEEVGCVGIQHMIGKLERTIGAPRACFVGEPTEMQVAVGHKGKAALRAVFLGQGGHSALAPKFLNALHIVGDFLAELRKVQDTLAMVGARDEAYDIPYSTVHVGQLSGGTALNIVPDRAEMIFEYRHLPADLPQDILERIQSAASKALTPFLRQFPHAAIEIDPYNAYPGLDVPSDAEVVVTAQGLAQTNGTTKVAFGTEAGFFDALGIPTIVCGPGSMEGQGHKPDEFVTLDQLALCDGMMDRLLSQLTGASDS